MATFDLTTGDDVFPQTGQATDANDLIRALGGADTVASGDGDDTVEGGDGNDRLYGGEGSDTLWGDAGDDFISDVAGETSAHGGLGRDYIVIADGWAYGGDDDDVLRASRSTTEVNLLGEGGADRIYGGEVSGVTYFLNGGDGADIIHARGGITDAFGGQGDDILIGDGTASLYGDGGNDLMRASSPFSSVWMHGGDGYDTISWRDAASGVLLEYDLGWIVGHGTAADGDRGRQVERYDLTDHDDAYLGDGAPIGLTMYGFGGDDQLGGGAGVDVFFGGGDDDVLEGGGGDDRLSGDAGADELWGGAGDDMLVGGAGEDLLYGEDGADRLYGSGDLRGGDGADIVQASGGEARGGAGNDRLYLTGGAQLASGDDGEDIIHANGSGAVLDGGAGYDTVSYLDAVGSVSIAADGTGGGAASGDSWVSIERFWLSEADDTVDFSAIGAAGQRLDIYGFDGLDRITGGAGRDRIDGGGGDDLLSGGDGNDVLISRDAGESSNGLIGGAGDDVLVCGGFGQSAQGNAGADLFLIEIGSRYTNIGGFEYGTDRLDISALVDAGATYTITYDGYYDVRYVSFSTGQDVGFFNVAAADLQALLDEAYGVSPPPPPGAPAEPEGARFAEPGPAFVFSHGEWLLG